MQLIHLVKDEDGAATRAHIASDPLLELVLDQPQREGQLRGCSRGWGVGWGAAWASGSHQLHTCPHEADDTFHKWKGTSHQSLAT